MSDYLFIMAFKSMIAKVFTVLGLFKLYSRPFLSSTSLSPTRIIIGGDATEGYEQVKVIPDALELYVRLPLLAEWYRETLLFRSDTKSADKMKISFVPSLDGVFSDFVRIIFVNADYIKQGSYTDNHLRELIKSVNKIYDAYKSKHNKSVTRAAIQGFIAEVNKRFGLLKQNEINKYLDEQRVSLYMGNSAENGDDYYANLEDTAEFDILDADNYRYSCGRQCTGRSARSS
jgi:hypothetical protein